MRTMKPVLMIHTVTEEMLKLPLNNYVLTFDDALFSQYHFFPRLQKFNTEMVFFVSTNIICDTLQSYTFINSKEAHKKAFEGCKEDFMTLQQIQYLSKQPNVSIGGHSHSHTRLSNFTSLVDKVKYIEEDTKHMIEWFQQHLLFTPTKFCFPYNEALDGMYTGLLKKYGFTEFYGRERIPIETLLQT